MKLYGKLIKERKIFKEEFVINIDDSLSFHDKMEMCFIEVCRLLDTPVPLWLNKNTKEFVRYRKTVFSNEQFMDKIWFDKLEIRLEE